MKELIINSLIEVVVTEKVLEKHPARDGGYSCCEEDDNDPLGNRSTSILTQNDEAIKIDEECALLKYI